MNLLLPAAGGALTGILTGCAVAYLATRHITARAIRQLEAAGRADEAAAARAVLQARVQGTAPLSTPRHLPSTAAALPLPRQ